MKVCEIFASIQGESTYVGMPCVFVRMTGCNLRCSYCDTTYAYNEGKDMSDDEIIETVKSHRIKLVEITGGEPLLQKDILSLTEKLLDDGFSVLIETNGSVGIKDIDKRAVIIMDIKTPKSGMSDKMNLDNLNLLKSGDELKFVITDREDYEWTKEFIKKYQLINKCKILLSPAFGILQPSELSQWMLADELPARLNLQIHKYIYGNEQRGI
ncbi:MAG: 7-carboxy-7-deazaguanine synthase QueE [Thermodesulfovibrio sp.]|nr:7-carboxy-7-deazaguanine synthase QueE [Thermodesulfovibrio sp.]